MKENFPLVSVIIPVYNVEKYLSACLTSVTTQTYANLDIVLVDDGATDRSGKICDAWAKKDRRITVVHQKNAGLNMARKSGFTASRGEYVTFLDSDDCFHPDAIKNPLAIVMEKNVDMVAYAYLAFSDKEEKEQTIQPLLTEVYDYKTTPLEVFQFLIRGGYENLYPMTAWGKLYKRSLIEQVDWEKSNMRAFEDNFFTPQVLDNVTSFVVLNQQLYLYRRNDTSDHVLSKTVTGNHLNGQPVGYLEYLNLLRDYWLTFIKKHNLDLEEELHEFWLSNMLFRLRSLIEASALCQENNTEYIMEITDYLQVRHGREVARQQQTIEQLTQSIVSLEKKVAELDKLHAELRELKTVRGSLRNTKQQLHRRLRRGKK